MKGEGQQESWVKTHARDHVCKCIWIPYLKILELFLHTTFFLLTLCLVIDWFS